MTEKELRDLFDVFRSRETECIPMPIPPTYMEPLYNLTYQAGQAKLPPRKLTNVRVIEKSKKFLT